MLMSKKTSINRGLDHIVSQSAAKGFEKDQCAATELNGNSRDGAIAFAVNRTDTIQGEVHDEKSALCDERLSGHAGLFRLRIGA